MVRMTERHVYRSWSAVALVAAGWTMAAAFLAVAIVVATTGQAQGSDLLVVGVPLVALGSLAAVWASVRVSVTTNSDGIEVRNVFGTWRTAWDEVQEVGIRHFGLWEGLGGRLVQPGAKRPVMASRKTPPGLGFRLRNGRQIPAATATVYLGWSQRQKLLEELADGLRPYGVEVAVRPKDLE
jgi:hypothetical protein